MRQARKLSLDEAKTKLTIDVDITLERLAKSGKSFVLYNTEGFFEKIEGTPLEFKLTVIRRFNEEEKGVIPNLSIEESAKLQNETRPTKL